MPIIQSVTKSFCNNWLTPHPTPKEYMFIFQYSRVDLPIDNQAINVGMYVYLYTHIYDPRLFVLQWWIIFVCIFILRSTSPEKHIWVMERCVKFIQGQIISKTLSSF